MNRQTASLAAGSDLDRILSGGSVVGLDDGLLLDRVARGDPPEAGVALDTLIRRHGALVARVCGGIVGDRHAAADAAQAVFLVLSRRAGSIRDPDRLASWLYGVSLRTARAARARLARQRRHLDPGPLTQDDFSMIDPTPDPSQTTIRREQAEILHRAIARLPQRYLDPIVLCDLAGMTHAEAAAQLGCPPVTVSVRLKRARDQLRARLSRHRLDFETALPPVLAAESFLPSIATPTPAAHLLAQRVAWSLALAKCPIAAALVVLLAGGTALGVRAGEHNQSKPPPIGSMAVQEPTPLGPVQTKAGQSTGKTQVRDITVYPAPPSPPATTGTIKLGYPIVRDVTPFAQYPGVLAASRSVEIRAHLNGALRIAAVEDGAMVQQGDILFNIHDAQTEDGLREKSLELTAARNQMIQAEAANDNLINSPATTNEELRAANQRYGAVEKRYKAVVAEVNRQVEEATTIRAPFAGQVARRPVDVGATVEVGKTPLATISTTDPIWANFAMDEASFLVFQRRQRAKGTTVNLPVRVALSDEQGFPHAGLFKLQAARPSPGNGTFTVHAELANADGVLFPGLSARVRVEVGEPHPAILVPDSAILYHDNEPRVFLVDGNLVAHWEPVRLGSTFDGLREITSKFDPASRIVLEGVENVRDGVPLSGATTTADPDR